jgi:hypothetical protein
VIRILELALAVDAPPVPYLEGRWFTTVAGERAVPGLDAGWLRAGEVTSGRAMSAAVGGAG